MRTVKVQKSVGKTYVFTWGQEKIKGSTSHIEFDKLKEIHTRRIEHEGYDCSDISEVETFKTVEEEVPHVVDKYLFFWGEKDGPCVNPHMHDSFDSAFKDRECCYKHGSTCSDIIHIQTEF